jgi:hypothetical protein
VNQKSLDIIEKLAAEAKEPSLWITSTMRTPRGQAKTMYGHCQPDKEDEQKGLYGPNGRAVIDVYVVCRDDGQSEEQIIAAMEAKIWELGPANVSGHCRTEEEYAKRNYIDISEGSFTNPAAFDAVCKDAKTKGILAYYIDERGTNGCFHLEILID